MPRTRRAADGCSSRTRHASSASRHERGRQPFAAHHAGSAAPLVHAAVGARDGGMVAGVLLGHFAPQVGERMQPLGDAFIKAMRMLIAPIVFATVVVGIASMGDMARVGRVALKALIYFEVMTTIALVLALAVVNIWRPGAGMHIDVRTLDPSAVVSYTRAPEQGVIPFLMNIIPGTVMGAFADGNVLQV